MDITDYTYNSQQDPFEWEIYGLQSYWLYLPAFWYFMCTFSYLSTSKIVKQYVLFRALISSLPLSLTLYKNHIVPLATKLLDPIVELVFLLPWGVFRMLEHSQALFMKKL